MDNVVENKKTGRSTRNYCRNSLHIYHHSGEICLQSHSNQARRIRSSESVGCFHFSVFLFNPMTNMHFIGKFFTALKFKTGFVSVTYTCYAVSMTLGFSNFAGLPHRTHFVDDAEVVREYVGLYVSAPQMQPKDVQNYRKLSEYGDVVFAGMYSQKHGFMFCSWRQSDGGKYVAHGNYSPDYLVSKENFAVRAGLVDDNKLFTKEEAEELFKCAAFARDNCESLTYEQDRGLMELMEKLQTAYRPS